MYKQPYETLIRLIWDVDKAYCDKVGDLLKQVGNAKRFFFQPSKSTFTLYMIFCLKQIMFINDLEK